jgi:hypothetical protein
MNSKSVFISYRHKDIYMARSVYYELRLHEYDVFIDYHSIDSGGWLETIRRQIDERPHFLVILTPTALKRCVKSDDILRLEIEHAIRHHRNIVPLMFAGFNFQKHQPALNSPMTLLSRYNGIRIPDDYFEEAMERLRNRFLSRLLPDVNHPTLNDDA